MVGVEQWAEIRRMHFVAGLVDQGDRAADGPRSQHGPAGAAVERAAALSSARPRPSKLDPFREEIHRLLREDGELPGQRDPRADRRSSAMRAARRSWMTTCARSGRCSRRRATFQRTVYRPGEVCQFDLWEPQRQVPVGHGRARAAAGSSSRAWATRARAPARWSSPRRRRICSGASRAVCGRWAGCRARWSGTARPGSARRGGRPTSGVRRALRPAAGRLALLPSRRDPQAKGAVERLQGYLETNFEPGRHVRQRARLPGPARRLVRQGQRAHAQDAALPAGRPAARRARARWRRCRRSRISTAAG